MTIDLGDHEITSNLNAALFRVNNGAKLVLTGDGTISAKKWIVQVNNGEVVVESGNYNTQNEGFKAIGTSSKVTINGGTISSVECALGANRGGFIELNGGNIITSDNMGIGTNGSSGEGGNTIIMNGGKIDANIVSAGYEAIGVYIANNDEFIMNGGEIKANGGTGLCMRAGHVVINDGTIIATGTKKDGTPVADGKIADSPVVMTGVSAVIYHESADYPSKAGMKLEVKGGIITGVDNSVEVLSNEEVPQVFVTGGNLTPAYP